MSSEKVAEAASPARRVITRTRPEVMAPGYDLAASVGVAQAIHLKGQGAATAEHLASFLGYKGTNNGAFLTKVSAARSFGLITKNGNHYVPTPLALRIITPVYRHEAQQALVDAFFNIQLFKKVYEEFQGKQLPEGLGIKNALRGYGVRSSRLDFSLRNLLDSAETAGFFTTKAGARTHLIMPMIHVGPAFTPPPKEEETGNDSNGDTTGGGGGGGGGEPPPTKERKGVIDLESAKAQYVSTLIKLFENKSEKGELDDKLMERIERILGMPP